MAAIIVSDTVNELTGVVDRNGRRFTRSILVGGLTGLNRTTRYTTAFSTAGVDYGDPWPDSPGTPSTGLNVYCSEIRYSPGPKADSVRLTYTYESFPEDISVEVGTVEMQMETCLDGNGAIITTEHNGKIIPMKITRNYCNVERIIRWSQFASGAAVYTVMGYANHTTADHMWLCRSVNAVAARIINNAGNGLYLFTVRMEYKIDSHDQVAWLEDNKGNIIPETVKLVQTYPVASFPSGWL